MNAGGGFASNARCHSQRRIARGDSGWQTNTVNEQEMCKTATCDQRSVTQIVYILKDIRELIPSRRGCRLLHASPCVHPDEIEFYGVITDKTGHKNRQHTTAMLKVFAPISKRQSSCRNGQLELLHELAAQNLQRGTSTGAPPAAGAPPTALASTTSGLAAAATCVAGVGATGVAASSSHKLFRFSLRLARSSGTLGAVGGSRVGTVLSVAGDAVSS